MSTAGAEIPPQIHSPYPIAPDTWVVPETVPAAPGTVIAMNAMVITGSEPVIVDTGNALSAPQWLEGVFSVVDPADVRWVFLSHEDHDHSGNLAAVLDLCPQATLVTTALTVERLVRTIEIPLERMRWVNSGESFDAGDRVLVAVRPPIFDAPTTRGLFDPTTGVYCSADAFSALLPEHLTDAADAPYDLWSESLVDLNCLISPWHTLVRPAAFGAEVDALAALGITTIASAHCAPVRGERLTQAFRLIRTIPGRPAPAPAGQRDLDRLLAAGGPAA